MSLTVGELNATINLDNRGFNRAVDQSESKFRGFGSSIHNVASGIAPAAAAIGLSFGAIAAGAGALALKALTLSANMEQSRIAFTTMLGDAKTADDFIRKLQKFAASTPFEFVGLQENAKRLLAMGFSAKEIIPTLTNVGDAVAALGSGDAGLQNITYALGQMKTAGKVHTQDMMQLTNAGVAAWDMLAKHLGVTVSQAQDMVQRGVVSSSQGLDAIMSGMHARYGGLMDKQSHTIAGLFSNLQDIATQSLTIVGDSIAKTFDVKGKIGALTDFMQVVTAGFQKGGARGAFTAALEQFISPDAVEPAIENLAKAFSSIGDAFGRIGSAVGSALSGPLKFVLGPGAINLWDNLDGVLVVVAAVVGGILTAAFAALAISVLAATWPLLLIGAGIGLVALAAYELWKHWGSVMRVLQPFTSIVGPKLKELWAAIQPSLQKVREQLGPIGAEFSRAFNEWKPTLEWIANVILHNLGDAFAFFMDASKVEIPMAIDFALTAIHNLAKAFDGIGALLRGDWGRAWTDFKGIIDSTFQSLSQIHIPLPHFSMKGGFDPRDWAQGKNLPGLDVNWYDRGGLFRGGQIIGVGEKRTEMVGALDDVFPMMVRAFREANTGGRNVNAPINIYGNPNPRKLARELSMELA